MGANDFITTQRKIVAFPGFGLGLTPMCRFFSFVALLLLLTPLAPGQLIISEFMASNKTTLFDSYGESSDWIEIQNTSTLNVALGDFYLTDDASNLVEWNFPATNLAAGAYALVFASDRELAPANGFHANFKLGASGEFLALVHSTGGVTRVVDAYAPTYPAQQADISYGRVSLTNASEFGYMTIPTPGADNAVSGPYIVEVVPQQLLPLTTNDHLTIRAHVIPNGASVEGVELIYQVNFGPVMTNVMYATGNYYTHVVSNSNYSAGDMVRWFVRAEDANGITRLPGFKVRTGQNQSPEYFGSLVTDPAVESNLPVLHWWVENISASNTDAGTRASAWFNGEFYDNFFVRIRGASTRGLVKKSYKFDFSPGNHFRFNFIEPRAEEFNLNTTYTDKTYVRQPLGYELYARSGCPAPTSELWRIEQNGDFFSVASFVENPDEDMLARVGLDPDGALYKMFNAGTGSGNAEKKTRTHEGMADLDAFLTIRNLSGLTLRNFIFDHVDVPRVMNYLATTVLIQHNDCMSKNYYLYRDSEGTGEWFFIPWDEDLSFGRHYMTADNIRDDELFASWDYELAGRNNNVAISPSHPFVGMQSLPGNRSWNRIMNALYSDSAFVDLYRRRLRTLMDELLQPAATPYGERFIEQRIDEWVAVIGDDAERDRMAWPEWGIPMSINQAVDALKADYLDVRRPHLFDTHLALNAGSYPEANAFSALLPEAQSPYPAIQFGYIDFNPVSNIQDEETIEMVNTNEFAVDLSGWTVDDAVEHTFSPGVVIPANGRLLLCRNEAAYRRGPRASGEYVTGNYQGGLSNFGETLNLRAPDGTLITSTSYMGQPTAVQSNLRISEIHYRPLPPHLPSGELNVDADEFEFVEWINAGTNDLDISGVYLTNAVEFVVPENRVLAPGERVLIVANLAAFESRYGAGLPVLGEYNRRLGRDERVETQDALTHPVQEITLRRRYAPLSEGAGPSREVLNVMGEVDSEKNWTSSAYIGGTPGGPPVPSIRDVVVNEVLTHADLPLVDAVEFYNTANYSLDIGGWWISDSFDDPFKYQVPQGVLLPPGGFAVFDEHDFRPIPTNSSVRGFAFDATNGDEVVLMAVDAGGRPFRIADGVEFGASRKAVSFSSYPDGQSGLHPGFAITLGTYNVGARDFPLVITEVMYDAPHQLRFVEMYNNSSLSLSLDTWGLRIDSVPQYFLQAGAIDPGEVYAAVAFDPLLDTNALVQFEAVYGTTNNLVGPLSEIIPGDDGAIALIGRETDPAGMSGDYDVRDDYVPYKAEAPWPVVALGQSINRLSPRHPGADPSAWVGALPSPGSFVTTTERGYSGWRINAFPPGTSLADQEPGADPNGNGLENMFEYLFGLDPLGNDPVPKLVIDFTGAAGVRLTHPRTVGADDGVLRFGMSTDLDNWSPASDVVTPSSPPLDLGDNRELLAFGIHPIMTNETLYLRLEGDLFE